jgi:hypothetical protein
LQTKHLLSQPPCSDKEGEPPGLGELSGAISDFFTYVDKEDTELTICSLELISNILVHSPFEEEAWRRLLKSDLLGYLSTQLSSDWPRELLGAMLGCLAHILLYPPLRQLEAILDHCRREDFVQHLLNYTEWVECELRHPYLLILSRLAGLYDAPRAALLEEASRLASALPQQVPDDPDALVRIEDLGLTMLEYLARRCSGEIEDHVVPTTFVQQYIERLTSDEIICLPDEALCSLFQGIATAIEHFPQCCETVYRASFAAIDKSIRGRGEVYPSLRASLLKWVAGLARYRPLFLNWDLDDLLYFGDPESPDEGIPALEITALILRDSWDNRERFSAPSFCDLIAQSFCVASFARKIALAKCLHAFFQHVATDEDLRGCSISLCELAPGLEEMLRDTQKDPAIFTMIERLVTTGICDPENLPEFCRVAERQSNGRGRAPSDADVDHISHDAPELTAGVDGEPDTGENASEQSWDRGEGSSGGFDASGESILCSRVCLSGHPWRQDEQEGLSAAEEEEFADATERGHEAEEDELSEAIEGGIEAEDNEEEEISDPGNEAEELEEEEEEEEKEDERERGNSVNPGTDVPDGYPRKVADIPEGYFFSEDSDDDLEFDLECMRFVNPFRD